MKTESRVWRPYTQHQTMPELINIASGKGPFLYTEDGRELVDLISSWWVNIHGHAHPVVAAAIAEQASRLEHVIFAGFTHEPAEQLANELLPVMGEPFSRIFYSDNGSTAVEVALKMALHFAINHGDHKRNKILAFDGGFHGDTWAAMCAGRYCGFFESYGELLNLEFEHVQFPATYVSDECQQEKEDKSLQQLDALLNEKGEQIAAMIIEPLVQGASGMRMCSESWLEGVVRRVRKRNIKVIFDEVMTGFGRTGKMFSYQHLNVRPDIVCLSKGITAGFLPFAATVATEEVYEAFLGDSFSQALAHGHSYAGNPIACAAAVASLKLFETEKTLDKIQKQTEIHHQFLPHLTGTKDHRIKGAIAACEIGDSVEYGGVNSIQLRERFLKAGLVLRPLSNSLYLIPPACVDPELLTRSYQLIEEALNS